MKPGKPELLQQLCYTELVYGRIRKKLSLPFNDKEIEHYVHQVIEQTPWDDCEKRGKNYYIMNYSRGVSITVNSFTMRVITADKIDSHYTIKTADETDQEFLFEMLYQSIFVKPGFPPPERSILHSPEISKYVEGWGREGDYALIALDKYGNKAAAVWLRYFDKEHKGYGYISDDIPELGIAVDEKFRGKGLGTVLLTEILKRVPKDLSSISLSVQTANPAVKLYRRFGFTVYQNDGDSLIMRYNCIA